MGRDYIKLKSMYGSVGVVGVEILLSRCGERGGSTLKIQTDSSKGRKHPPWQTSFFF